ncbi:MAG: tryptophan--tRNA ligase [Candidatus Aenigmatarchaeota archaeon]
MAYSKEMLEMVEKDYSIKLALGEKERRFYEQKMEELGLKSVSRFASYHPSPSRFMKMGVTYAHKDLESVAPAMENGDRWAAVSGLNPSGPLHLGHKAIFDELLWFQEQGATVYIPVTNDETYLVRKKDSLGESRRIAYEDVIPSIIAMGFKPGKTRIFVDSDYTNIYNLAIDISRELTVGKINGVFGVDESQNIGVVFYRGAVQLAQILLPQLEEFGGTQPTVIPVGIDQHPYIQLARDIAKKKGMVPPAEVCTKFLFGLDGKGKMSTSRPESAIFLTDTPERAEKLIKTSYNGGSAIADLQRERGGIPEICPIYGLDANNFLNDDSVYKACRSGQLMCGEHKKEVTPKVKKLLLEHQEKLADARNRMHEFILNEPLTSVFKHKK